MPWLLLELIKLRPEKNFLSKKIKSSDQHLYLGPYLTGPKTHEVWPSMFLILSDLYLVVLTRNLVRISLSQAHTIQQSVVKLDVEPTYNKS